MDKTARPWWLPSLQTMVVLWMVVTTPFIIVFLRLYPPDNSDELFKMIAIAYTVTGFGTALTYAVGSSKGSQTKDEGNAAVVEKLMAAPVSAAAVTAAAEAAAPVAAAKAAPAAAKIEAPPAAEAAAPEAARKAVADVLRDPANPERL